MEVPAPRVIVRVTSLLGVLCSGMPFKAAAAEQGDTMAQVAGATRTTFVTGTLEPISAPFPTIHNLPRTLSIDPLTEAEIQQARLEILEQVRAVAPMRVEAIDGCMQWFFMRHDASQPWRAFGFGRQGHGLAKLNGALRSTSFHYSINPVPVKGLVHGLWGPGKKGGGDMRIHSFEVKSSYKHLRAAAEADDALVNQLNLGTQGTDARFLSFGATNALRVSKPSAACTLMRARCRTYELTVNEAPQWVGSITRNAANFAADHVFDPIDSAPRYTLEIAIEDMCPFSREALVEGPLNTRAGGAEPGVRRYGIMNNASLKDALAPYARWSKP